MRLLAQLRYLKNEYIFAFDDPKYEPLLDKKIVLMKKYIPQDWKLKFYIYIHPDMSIKLLIMRAEWCRANKCLPYVMRDAACWEDEKKDFYTDYAAYCNQPSFFKKLSFEEFLRKRHTNTERVNSSLSVYESAVTAWLIEKKRRRHVKTI